MSGNGRLMNILLAPVVSEKSTELGDKLRTVSFRVAPDARKDEVARAAAKLFEVKVEKVRIVNMRGRAVARGGVPGRRASWKKAYIRLAEGSDINFSELS